MESKKFFQNNSHETEAYINALSASCILSISDPAGNILFANEKFLKKFGILEEDLPGKNYRDFNSGIHGKEFFSEMWQAIIKKETWTGEICNRNNFGELLWFSTTIVPILNANNEIDKFITIRHDITELKDQQAENWRQIQFQASINLNTNNIVMRTDLDGVINYVNIAFEKMIGYQSDELIHQQTPEFLLESDELIKRNQELNTTFHIDQPVGLNTIFYRTTQNIKNDYEWTFNCKNKSKKIIKLAISYLLDQEQIPIGYILVGTDITELKLIEQNLINSKKELEKTIHLKNQFLSRLSHEIKTPLNGILGMVDLLENTVINSEQKDYLESIQKSSQRLLSLINKTVEYNKVENGDFDINEISFSIIEEISQIEKWYKPIAESKSLEFNIVNNLKNKYFFSDSKRIFQVVGYFLENAITYTPKGKVELFFYDLDADKICIQIKDNGPGIDQDKIKNLFTPFMYEKVKTNDDLNGLGLSLSIAMQIAKKLNANINCYNHQNGGAVFELQIEMKSLTILDEVKKNKVLANLNIEKLKVLIVEDDAINQRLLKKTLNKYNLFPIVAQNGVEALDLQKENMFDLIFMDINMPLMDGLEATKKIRENQKTYGTPYIVAVTANSVTGDREMCLSVGMDDFLSKPVSKDRLFSLLEDLLGPDFNLIKQQEDKEKKKFYIEKILQDFKDDEEILGEFILKVSTEVNKQLDILEQAIKENHFEQIRMVAYSLQGLMGNLYQEEIKRTLEIIETYGKEKKVRNIFPMFNDIKNDINSVILELNKYFLKKAV